MKKRWFALYGRVSPVFTRHVCTVYRTRVENISMTVLYITARNGMSTCAGAIAAFITVMLTRNDGAQSLAREAVENNRSERKGEKAKKKWKRKREFSTRSKPP